MFDFVVFASYGNDSIALIQWCRENEIANVIVVHCDTGWASPDWHNRVDYCEQWVESIGYAVHCIESIGMIQLVRKKKGWPRNGLQFCTEELKIRPSMAWLEEIDPGKEIICAVGVRREESARRRSWPEYIEQSDKHGGRSLWSPLVNVKERERDTLVIRAGFEILPHRSKECYPCINANKRDLRELTSERVNEIEALESSMGYTNKGKPRTMFRPYKHMGATGIRETCKWANSEHGKYKTPLVILGTGTGCDSGMCGD